MTVTPLLLVKTAIQNMQKNLFCSNKYTEIDEKTHMHSEFENAIKKLIHPKNIRHEVKYSDEGINGLGENKVDYVLYIPPDLKEKAFIELTASDRHYAKTLAPNIRKIKKNIYNMSCPDIMKYNRFNLFGIRWDLHQRHDINKQKQFKKTFLAQCNASLNITNLHALEKEKYLERIFIFGAGFCYDISTSDAKKIIGMVK